VLRTLTLRTQSDHIHRNTALAIVQLLPIFLPFVVMTKDYFDPHALAATDSAAVFVNEVFENNVITTRLRLTSTLRTK
jgi:hypothetical protein